MCGGVIFDMDGVLVDSGAAHHESWRRLAIQYGIEISEQRFKESFGRPSRDIIRLIWGAQVSDADIARYDAEKEAVYRRLISGRVPLMPGCRSLLERLRAAGLRLAVATSGPPENLDLVLDECDLRRFFAALVHGYDVLSGKPAPDCFVLAAQRLRLPADHCLVVEDAPVGIQAAVAAGMPVIALVGTHAAGTLLAAGAARIVQHLDAITPELVVDLLSAR
mgnify:CR=1 FL=1